MIRAPTGNPSELVTVILMSKPITASDAPDALLLPDCSFTMTKPRPERFMRVLGAGLLARGTPFTVPFWNTVEPELVPVPFQAALAVVVTWLAWIKPDSRFKADVLLLLLALALVGVVCPEALLVSLPTLPTLGSLIAFAVTVEEPPLQLIPAAANGPIDGVDPPSP